MAYIDEFPSNCGMRIIAELDGGPEDAIVSVCQDPDVYNRIGLLAFTDAEMYEHGTALAAYIRKYKLGKLFSTHKVMNPNTKHVIQAWFWKPNKAALKKWYEKVGKVIYDANGGGDDRGYW